MSNNKTIKVFSSTAVAGMIAAAMMSSQAFAAVDAYSVKVGDQVYKYEKAQLEKAFLDSKTGEKSALYEDFTKKLGEAKGFYAFNDTKNGYVDYSSIEAKFLEAKGANQKFDLDGFTESKDAKIVKVETVKKAVVNKDGKVEYITEGEDEKASLDVTSVEVLSVKQVKINFNKVVKDQDKIDDIEDESNYTIYNDEDKELKNDPIDKVEMSKDRKSAIMTFKDKFDADNGNKFIVPSNSDDGIKNQETYKIEFDDNITGKEFTKKVKFNDFDFTKIESMEVVGSDSIKIKFSRPVRPVKLEDGVPVLNDDDVKINDDNISVSKIELSNNNTEATIKVGYTLKDGQKLKIEPKGSSIVDYSGYGVRSDAKDIVVKKNTAKPEAVGYKDVKKGKVTLIFNQDIKFDGSDAKIMAFGGLDTDDIFEDGDIKEWSKISNMVGEKKDKDYYHTNDTNGAYAAKIDGKELTLYFNEDLYGLPSTSAEINVKSDKLKNLWDEKNEKIVKTVKRTVDETKLAVKSVEEDKDNASKIEVKFNKEVSTKTAEKTSNYELRDEDGKRVNISSATRDTKKKVVILTSKDLSSGKYTLTIKDVEDVDGKAIEKVSKKFSATEKDARKSSDLTVNLYNPGKNDQRIVVDFDTQMRAKKDSTSIDTKTNYTLVAKNGDEEVKVFNGKSSVLLSTLYNSTVKSIQGDNKAEITIPYKKNKDDSYDFTKKNGKYHIDGKEFDTLELHVGKVEDVDGNVNPTELVKTVDGASYVDIKEEDGEILARAISTDKIQVTFDDKLDFKSKDLYIEDEDGNKVKTSSTDPDSKDGKTTVTITLDKNQKGSENEKYDDNKDHVLTYDAKFNGKKIYVRTVKQDEIKSKNDYDAQLRGGIKQEVIDAIAPALIDNSQREDEFKYLGNDKFGKSDNTNQAVEYKRVEGSDEAQIVLTFEEAIKPESLSNNTFTLDQDGDFASVRVKKVTAKGNKVMIDVTGLKEVDETDSTFGENFEVIQNQPIADMSSINRGQGNQVSGIKTQVGEFYNLEKAETISSVEEVVKAVANDKISVAIDSTKQEITVASKDGKETENIGEVKLTFKENTTISEVKATKDGKAVDLSEYFKNNSKEAKEFSYNFSKDSFKSLKEVADKVTLKINGVDYTINFAK
ncbi:Ig-like domain-containing protein [Clostridium massiliodielmoense]|uniref:Ig-like domain-containing protein n=1 Tax=Clostridium massiliodielmoense TaxID=1776385 RepID=UPI00065E0413|nr:hypothetical protein [Clostridium massiliodielmoense]